MPFRFGLIHSLEAEDEEEEVVVEQKKKHTLGYNKSLASVATLGVHQRETYSRTGETS